VEFAILASTQRYHRTKSIHKIASKSPNAPFRSLCACNHPAPCTLHHAPCTLHPAPCTLHPAPCTLHPAPCTLHPASLSHSLTHSHSLTLSLSHSLPHAGTGGTRRCSRTWSAALLLLRTCVRYTPPAPGNEGRYGYSVASYGSAYRSALRTSRVRRTTRIRAGRGDADGPCALHCCC